MTDEITEYLDARDDAVRRALARVFGHAAERVGDTTVGRSYGMAALLYRGKPLVAVVENRAFLSYYPFSGKVVSALGAELDAGGFDRTTGSVHFSLAHPLPDALLDRLVDLRREEIDRTTRR